MKEQPELPKKYEKKTEYGGTIVEAYDLALEFVRKLIPGQDFGWPSVSKRKDFEGKLVGYFKFAAIIYYVQIDSDGEQSLIMNPPEK